MAISPEVVGHLSEGEVHARVKAATGHWARQKWLVVFTALADPRPRRAIARELGVSTTFVHETLIAYNRGGPPAFATAGKGGRRRCDRGLEDERAFLEPFIARARAGQVATAGQVKAAWEAHLGHPVHETTVYRLLARHGWRKLAPRPVHPEADPAEQARFKRRSPSGSRR